jgi:hypothetical protein
MAQVTADRAVNARAPRARSMTPAAGPLGVDGVGDRFRFRPMGSTTAPVPPGFVAASGCRRRSSQARGVSRRRGGGGRGLRPRLVAGQPRTRTRKGAPTWKEGFAIHPLVPGAGIRASALAMLLRRGNAGSNTFTDHKAVSAAVVRPASNCACTARSAFGVSNCLA